MKNHTIRDVAREAGVSVSTASRVLNNRPDVAKETRERVQAAMERLVYVANPSARRLAGAKAHAVGLLLPGYGSGYTMETMRGVAQVLREASYDLIAYFAEWDRSGQERAAVASLGRGAVDGLVIAIPHSSDEELLELARHGPPLVLVDHHSVADQVPAVACTNTAGALEGTRYLFSLGHRRIGLITGELHIPAGADRLAGYRQAYHDAGLQVDEELIYRGSFRRAAGYEGTLALMALPKPPTAIFASSDAAAFSAMDALHVLNLRIPQDVSLLGFDDIPTAAESHPPLTTIHQPFLKIGRAAAEMLLRVIEGKPMDGLYQELPTRLMVRGTCARADLAT